MSGICLFVNKMRKYTFIPVFDIFLNVSVICIFYENSDMFFDIHPNEYKKIRWGVMLVMGGVTIFLSVFCWLFGVF